MMDQVIRLQPRTYSIRWIDFPFVERSEDWTGLELDFDTDLNPVT